MEPTSYDPKFGTAKVGDMLPLPSPFVFGDESIGLLTKVDKVDSLYIHTYDLFVFGARVGTFTARQVEEEDGVLNVKFDWR